MSANLSVKTDGTVEMFAVVNQQKGNTPPWHERGTQLSANATGSEALAAAKLGWTVRPDPIYTADMQEIKGFKAITRSDDSRVLGVVSDRWHPFQNVEVVEFADAIVGTKNAYYNTAGALGAGADVWFLLEMPGELRIGAFKDEYKKYFLLANNHAGKRAFHGLPTGVRVVCQNTFNAAMGRKDEEGIKIRHTGDLKTKAEEAKRVLGLAEQQFEVLAERLTYLSTIQLSEPDLGLFLELMFPLPLLSRGKEEHTERQIENVRALRATVSKMVHGAGTGLDRPGIPMTAYAAVQAITEHFDHHRRFRTAETRMEGILWNGGPAMKRRAFDYFAPAKTAEMAGIS